MSKIAGVWERLKCVERLGGLRADICSKIRLAVVEARSDP